MRDILSQEAIACTHWLSFYLGGMCLGGPADSHDYRGGVGRR